MTNGGGLGTTNSVLFPDNPEDKATPASVPALTIISVPELIGPKGNGPGEEFDAEVEGAFINLGIFGMLPVCFVLKGDVSGVEHAVSSPSPSFS